MKSGLLTYIAAISFLAVLAIPVRLAAQHKQDHNHHHYELIDQKLVEGGSPGTIEMGTFGDPTGNSGDQRGTIATDR